MSGSSQGRCDQPTGAQRARNRSADEIRAQIDQTRMEMDQTVSQLQHRLSPTEIRHRVMESVQHAAGEGARKMLQVIKDNPLPASIVGAGVVFMIMRRVRSGHHQQHHHAHAESHVGHSCSMGTPGTPGTPGTLGTPAARSEWGGESHAGTSTGERMKDKASRISHHTSELAHTAMDKVKHAGSAAAHAVSTAASGAAHTVRDVGHQAKDTAMQIGREVRDKGREGYEWADSMVHQYPLAAGAACFALGLAGGLAAPRTRKEDEVIGPARDKLMHEAESAGSDLLHKGEQLAERAVSALKGSGADRESTSSHQDTGHGDESEESSSGGQSSSRPPRTGSSPGRARDNS